MSLFPDLPGRLIPGESWREPGLRGKIRESCARPFRARLGSGRLPGGSVPGLRYGRFGRCLDRWFTLWDVCRKHIAKQDSRNEQYQDCSPLQFSDGHGGISEPVRSSYDVDEVDILIPWHLVGLAATATWSRQIISRNEG